MNINLHIERLVLDGVALEPHQRPALKASLEAELASLLGRNGVGAGLHNGGAVDAIRADSIAIGGKNEPSGLGKQIARSVYGGINQ
ncbi:MAG: hypothetical protein L3J62_11760 [Gammaproteobacteria bacterium]|nr:hypothetical protein [Gammaproteobacteria bacterium]MCF6231434.1 hypothetical protein [Gammaproteobacteria bacterium]